MQEHCGMTDTTYCHAVCESICPHTQDWQEKLERAKPERKGKQMPREMTWEQAADAGYIELLLDGARGVYIPRDAARELNWVPNTASPQDLKILESGPDHEWYWEAWETVLDNGKLMSSNGSYWTLYQDGDLFAIREDIEIDWDTC